MSVNILIVDDEEIITEILGDEMEELDGVTAFIASNGKEAIEVLNKENIQIVLTDFKMPVMNGAELIREIYSKFELSQIKTFMMTAYSPDDLQDLLKEFQVEVIRKPFSFEDIKNIVFKGYLE